MELCNFLSWIAYAEGYKGRKKEIFLKGTGSDGREYRVKFPGFKPVLHRPYVYKEEKSKNRYLIHIQVPDEKSLKKTVKNVLKKILGKEPSQKIVEDFIAKGKSIERKSNISLDIPLQVNLKKLYRAISKIAYQFLCFELQLNDEGKFPLLKGLFAIREFIRGSETPNYFCSIIPRHPLIELKCSHIVSLFSYNGLAMAYIKLFSFEFLVNFQAYWKQETPIFRIGVSGRRELPSNLEFRVVPNLGRLFPYPYILKWNLFFNEKGRTERMIPDINPHWLLYFYR